MRVLRHLQTLAIVMAASALLATPLSAQILYGASNQTPGSPGISDLYTIDPATGDATVIGSIGFENVTGMTCLPDGRMVASTRGDAVVPPGPASILIEIDPMSGAGTLIGTIGDFNAGSCGRMPDITYDDVTSTLYGYGDFCNGDPEGLFTVDPDTGAGTSVGATGYTGGGNGLAAEPGTGTLYATPFDDNSLITIDPVTGMGTEVPGSAGAIPFRVNSLVFHPDNGTLYGSLNDPFAGTSSLVTISTADGTTTTVGETVLNLDALTFECGVAEPETPIVEIPTLNSAGLALLVLLIAASAWMVMRRQRTE